MDGEGAGKTFRKPPQMRIPGISNTGNTLNSPDGEMAGECFLRLGFFPGIVNRYDRCDRNKKILIAFAHLRLKGMGVRCASVILADRYDLHPRTILNIIYRGSGRKSPPKKAGAEGNVPLSPSPW
jgi:hypothetical protein